MMYRFLLTAMVGPRAVLAAGLLAGAAAVVPAAAQDRAGRADSSGAGMAFSFISRVYTLAPTEGIGYRVLVAYAIPARRLPREGSGDRGWWARIRLTLIDSDGDSLVELDSVRNLSTSWSGGERYAMGLEELNLAPGSYGMQLYLGTLDGRIGLQTGLHELAVADLKEVPLWLSDLVLGREGEGGGLEWGRDRERVDVAPLHTYRAGTAIEVYYEVVGLPEGTAFETVISLTPVVAYNPAVREDAAPLVSFGYEETARSRFTPLWRTLNLGDFPPGRYRLTVKAIVAGGPQATRSTTIRVLGG